MKQSKLISALGIHDFEKALNQWLEENDKAVIHSTSFSSFFNDKEGDIQHTALIVYTSAKEKPPRGFYAA